MISSNAFLSASFSVDRDGQQKEMQSTATHLVENSPWHVRLRWKLGWSVGERGCCLYSEFGSSSVVLRRTHRTHVCMGWRYRLMNSWIVDAMKRQAVCASALGIGSCRIHFRYFDPVGILSTMAGLSKRQDRRWRVDTCTHQTSWGC